MDKKIENINIEKNKELFEYEMTEVILKLKGEFASFSGEGTVFEDSKVTDEDLRLELHSLKEVKADKYEGEVPTIKKFPVIKLREVAIDSNRKSKSAIQINAVKKVQIKDIKKEEIHISIPNTNYQFSELDLDNAEVGVADESVKQVVTVPKVNINCSSIDKIEIVKREVAVPETKYNFKEMQLKSVKCPDLRQIEFKMIPRISFSWKGSFEETKRLVMFEHDVPKFVIGLKKDDLTVEIRRPMITADVPSVANLALSVASVKIDKIRINIPKTNIVCKYEITEDKTEFYHLEQNVHKINIGSLKEVVIHKPDLDVTDMVRPKPICIKPVNNRHIIVDVPNTDITSLVSDYTKIRKKNVIFKMPQVSQLKSVKCPDLRQIEFKMIPRISFSWKGSFEETKRLVMFEHDVPKFVIGLKKDDLTVEIRRPMITADVPSVANLALSVASVKIDKIRINIPKTNIVCKYEITEDKTEFYHLEQNVHKINIGSLKEVVIHKPDLDVTDMVRPKPICIKPVNNRHIIVDVPNTDITSLVSDYTKIRKKNVIFKMPQVSQIKRCFITQYKPFQRKVIEVAVPNFNNEQLTINTVEVKPMHKVELPSKPNVDENISRIISLATNKQ